MPELTIEQKTMIFLSRGQVAIDEWAYTLRELLSKNPTQDEIAAMVFDKYPMMQGTAVQMTFKRIANAYEHPKDFTLGATRDIFPDIFKED